MQLRAQRESHVRHLVQAILRWLYPVLSGSGGSSFIGYTSSLHVIAEFVPALVENEGRNLRVVMLGFSVGPLFLQCRLRNPAIVSQSSQSIALDYAGGGSI